MPVLKKERPYIDKVRPLSLYIKWSLLHDFRFFMHSCFVVGKYLLKTQFKSYTKYNKNFKIKLRKILKINVHPHYERNAKRIFASRPDIQVVIMGHTHITEWRRFANGKLYFNSGTWNPVPSVDAALNKNIMELTYVMIEVSDKKKRITNAFLNVWKGKWRPYKEHISTSLR